MIITPEEIDRILKEHPITAHNGIVTAYRKDVEEYAKERIGDVLKEIEAKTIYESAVTWRAATFLMNLDNDCKAKGVRVIVLRGKDGNTDLTPESQEEIDEDRRQQLRRAGF